VSTINTMEDLIQVLDEHPEWLEALRARLLTRELLDLPHNFAMFVAEMREFKSEMREFQSEMREFKSEMREFKAQMDRFVAATDKRFDAVEIRLDSHDAMLKSITDDLGQLKGAHARSAALEDAAIIARDLGLRRKKNLTREDLLDLIDAVGTADIPLGDLRSFRVADLIMEARAEDGEICYVAVEISYTANGRDTRRAIRNAEFMTRFTGKRSFAVVSGLHRDDRIQDSIESGEVFWHQMMAEQLDAE
jgi:hypothetical protein